MNGFAMTMPEYLALPAVSSGVVRTMVDRCPRAGWFESYLNPDRVIEFADNTDAGTIGHAILLEGNADCCVVVDPAEYRSKPTKKDPLGNPAKGWNNDAIKEARDAIRASGKIPVLKSDFASILASVRSAQAYISLLQNTEPAIWAALQPGGGDSELVFAWDDDGIPCKIRTDRISTDRTVIVDAKFTATSAEPGAWGRTQMVRMGYYTNAAFYRRGIAATCGVEASYTFLVVETEPPYLCSLVGVDPAAFALGADKVATGLQLWRRCVESGRWPGYANRVCYPAMPVYESAAWEAREALDDLYERGLASQA